jgi:hypothetical protein
MLYARVRSCTRHEKSPDRSETMAFISKLNTTIGGTLHGSAEPANQAVHFHLSSDGRPFACDVHACDSAALTFGDLRLIHEVAQ